MDKCQSPHAEPFVETKGRVSRVEGDMLIVELDPQGCGRCHEPGGCGGQSLTHLSGKPQTYRVLNAINAHVGDRVSLQIREDLVRKAAVSAYVIPLLLCLAGALLGQYLEGDLAALAGAISGIALGWRLVNVKVFQVGGGDQSVIHVSPL